MPFILGEVLISAIAAVAGGTALQTLLKALVEHESLRKAISSMASRDVVGIVLAALGIASILISYFGWLWVQGVHMNWWQSLHLEAGVALIFVGFIDTLLMSRLRK